MDKSVVRANENRELRKAVRRRDDIIIELKKDLENTTKELEESKKKNPPM